MSVGRRAFVLGILALAPACKREARCKHCGMRIDPNSPWRSELIAADGSTTSFDTPRCAMSSWRSGQTAAQKIRVQEYYDRAWRDGGEVRFVVGGDVLGPMGPDLVPVDPPRAAKFIQDHSAARAYTVDEVTLAVLDSAK